MNRIVRMITNPLAPAETRRIHWLEMTEEEEAAACAYLREKIRAQTDDNSAILKHSDIVIPGTNIILSYLHIGVFNLLMREVTTRPYIVLGDNAYHYQAYFVQNLERMTSMLVPSAHLARAVVRDALAATPVGACAISLEPYTAIDKFCVGICGHVFSAAALELDKCPTCREPVAWAVVRREEL